MNRRPVRQRPAAEVNPFATWAAAGTIAAMLITTALSRATLHAPAPHMPDQTAAVLPGPDVDPLTISTQMKPGRWFALPPRILHGTMSCGGNAPRTPTMSRMRRCS